MSKRQLTKSLLRRDFDIDIELPDDRLCPPVGLYLVSVLPDAKQMLLGPKQVSNSFTILSSK